VLPLIMKDITFSTQSLSNPFSYILYRDPHISQTMIRHVISSCWTRRTHACLLTRQSRKFAHTDTPHKPTARTTTQLR